MFANVRYYRQLKYMERDWEGYDQGYGTYEGRDVM
jgi:hypothetical protein